MGVLRTSNVQAPSPSQNQQHSLKRGVRKSPAGQSSHQISCRPWDFKHHQLHEVLSTGYASMYGLFLREAIDTRGHVGVGIWQGGGATLLVRPPSIQRRPRTK